MDQIKSFIKDHVAEGVLFVLKGYDIIEDGVLQVNLAELIDNSRAKFRRVYDLQNDEISVMSFAEFILMFSTVVELFERIYVIENGIYYHLWPAGVTVPPNISNGLLTHFDQDADDELEIDDIRPYTEIFSNFIEVEGQFFCNFNLRDELLDNPKIYVRRFPHDTENCYTHFLDDMTFHNICDQEDYIRLIINLEKTDKSYGISVDNFIDSIAELKIHLAFLAAVYPGRIAYYHTSYKAGSKKCPEEILSIMNRYWGYSSFRNLKTYNMELLQEHRKEIIEVSQGDIVSNIIEQVENCLNEQTRDNIRDIFVTAPTGAGKSLMFQLPTMFLAQEYGLLTIVVSPLIALMEDQVKNLEDRGYNRAATINSDKSPIIKQQIYQSIMDGEIDLLYLSPESLLSRSDIEQLIGKRKIGLFVVDEAHIVTTWGKQFRPDYWFLGDHVYKLRRKQMNSEGGHPFIITTFTATAIYGGIEDMYRETLNSLHMVDPITYLGYIKRDNISIDVSEVEKINAKEEYEVNKFNEIRKIADTALMRGQKVLVYFPTVALIERCRNYWEATKFREATVCYGSLPADEKNENIEAFRNGDKLIMLATKAFGMGIDIPDITIVVHFAPTGNVCDYMQEIGRAARDVTIKGHAIYKHMSNDFKYINRLHGMSTIRNYQLTGVISKILDLYTDMRYSDGKSSKKKRNSMLLDANSFAYLFDEGNRLDENDVINKVKTAMLLIQKDYERQGFAPFHMRPIPIFAYGYFYVSDSDISILKRCFPNTVKSTSDTKKIHEINLEAIWQQGYQQKYSFPQFKYLLYSLDKELDLNSKVNLVAALKIEVDFADAYKNQFNKCLDVFSRSIKESMLKNSFMDKTELIRRIAVIGEFSKCFAENLTNVLLAAADVFQRNFNRHINSRPFRYREKKDGEYGLNEAYQFTSSMNEYFDWVRITFHRICRETQDGNIYVISGGAEANEILTCLGILEAMKVLKFKALGGLNSQLYIYVNETRQMLLVKNHPDKYKNRLLNLVNIRHEASVHMMTYLFQRRFTSDQIWDKLEDYFLGISPEGFQPDEVASPVDEASVAFVVGDSVQKDYQSWEELNVIFDNSKLEEFARRHIPLPEFMSAKIYVGEEIIDCCLAWELNKLALTLTPLPKHLEQLIKDAGWKLYTLSEVEPSTLQSYFLGD